VKNNICFMLLKIAIGIVKICHKIDPEHGWFWTEELDKVCVTRFGKRPVYPVYPAIGAAFNKIFKGPR